jgi:hypothetical protein
MKHFIKGIPCLLLALHLLGGCKKNDSPGAPVSPGGLEPDKLYFSNTIHRDHGVRVFTVDGEVTTPAVIARGIAWNPDEFGPQGTVSHADSAFIQTTQTNIVSYQMAVNCTSSVQNGIFDMRQVAPEVYDYVSGWGSSPEVFLKADSLYFDMRRAVLQMHTSYETTEQLNATMQRSRYYYHFVGTYDGTTLMLPYTIMSFRGQLGIVHSSRTMRYNFAMLPNPTPVLHAGDTLVMQEGRMEFHPR